MVARHAAIVLAGGAGRRMGGRHKPSLPVGGSPMLVRVLDAVSSAWPRVVVGQDQPVPPGVTLVRERPPGGGPVAAIAAGLSCLADADPDGDRLVAVLAADQPFLTAESIAVLLDAATGAARPVAGAAFVAGRPQLLCGVWRAGAVRDRLAAIGDPRGVPVRRLLGDLPFVPVPGGVGAAGAMPPWYDCDTPDDLARADRLLRTETAMTTPQPTGTGPDTGGANTLDGWVAELCRELGLPGPVDRDLVLDLAKTAAHGVARPAAPLTTYLLGVAVGAGADPADAAARITRLAENRTR